VLLQNRHTLVHAGNGAIAQGVAREMAHQGAAVHLIALRPAELQGFADEIGAASLSALDATEPGAVRARTEGTARDHGLHVVFNGIGGRPASLGYPARSDETPLHDF
jgi:NAD(P)-dependent dehydrogenase (short-subunit alcohol dehydrogenase family)